MLIGFCRKEVLKFFELKKMEMFILKKKKILFEMNIYMYDGVFLIMRKVFFNCLNIYVYV